MRRGAILATNTSTLDVDQIAAATSRPQDVIGTHFFSPANVMRLLEVVRAEQDRARTCSRPSCSSARELKKVVWSSGRVRRLHRQPHARAVRPPVAVPDRRGRERRSRVDAALTKFGLAMGPFAHVRHGGHGHRLRDPSAALRREAAAELFAASPTRSCELGRLGQKTGKGWYRYEAGNRTPLADPEIDALIEKYRAEIGMAPRAIGDAGNRRALHLCARQRGRANPRGGHRAARQRHRRRLPDAATASRPRAAARCSMRRRSGSTRSSRR